VETLASPQRSTTNAFDSHGNLTSVTSPAPSNGVAASVTQFTYNSLGELVTITDPLNNVTTRTATARRSRTR